MWRGNGSKYKLYWNYFPLFFRCSAERRVFPADRADPLLRTHADRADLPVVEYLGNQ